MKYNKIIKYLLFVILSISTVSVIQPINTKVNAFSENYYTGYNYGDLDIDTYTISDDYFYNGYCSTIQEYADSMHNEYAPFLIIDENSNRY